MPLAPHEAYGLFQTEVNRIGHGAEMLRIGAMGYQQLLQENEALKKEITDLKAKLGIDAQQHKPALQEVPKESK